MPNISKSTEGSPDAQDAAPDAQGNAANAQGNTANAQGDATLRRLHLLYAGEVQGVGFRWASRLTAERLGCTGWVRNEPDGTVTQELQGTDDQIAAYFGAFARVYAAHPIKYVIAEKSDIDVVEGEANFRVRF